MPKKLPPPLEMEVKIRISNRITSLKKEIDGRLVSRLKMEPRQVVIESLEDMIEVVKRGALHELPYDWEDK